MRILDCGEKKRAFTLVAFDATGQTLVADGGYKLAVVWEVVTGAERTRFEGCGPWLRLNPVRGRFLFPTASGLRSYDPSSNVLTSLKFDPHHRGALAFAPDEDWAVQNRNIDGRPSLLAASRFGEPDETVHWEVALTGPADSGGYVSSLACLPGGGRFFCAEYITALNSVHNRWRIAIRSRADGQLLQSSPDDALTGVESVFGSHWSEAIVAHTRGLLRVFRCDDLAAPPRIIRNDGRKHFTAVAFHPSGHYLAATSNDETVKLYDTATWEVARTFTWDIGRMRSIAFSPDGTLAAAGSDKGKVVVWDVDL